MDWEFVKQQSRIVDIKHARRIPSQQKCKTIDAGKRVMKKLRVNKLSIYKQLGVCVKPSLSTSNVEAKMFNKRNAGVSQVKRKASSKRNASGITSSYFLSTSTDVVTQFFFPFNRCGKVAFRKKLALSEEDILARKVSDFFFNLRRSTKIKKKKRGVRHRMAEPRNVFPDGMNARKSAPRLRKTRKKKKPGVKKDRVLVKQDPVHSGPRYNISFQEVWRAYGRMRKGRGFYPSNRVLWKNRHALVLGCSNFYGKPDPIVPTTGKEFSSHTGGDGPVPWNTLSVKNKSQTKDENKENPFIMEKIRICSPIQNLKKSRSSNGRGGHTQQEQPTVPEIDFSKILHNTAHRRKSVKLMTSTSPQVQHTHGRMQRRYSGARRNVLVDSSDCTTDSVLWEYMCKVGKTPPDKALLKIISDYDHRDRTQELEKSINHLEELINEGNDRPMIVKVK